MEDMISVIVPVYNSEKYLRACVKSIAGQSWENLEIILVDDGSTDASPGLCDCLAAEDGRIRVIHKQNEGAALAREDGLMAAQGRWAAFVDADDCLDGRDALKTLGECAERTGADVTVGNYRKQSGAHLTGKKSQHFFDMKDTGCVQFRFNGFMRDGHLAYEWGKLYRRDFLLEKGIRHTPYPFTQDKAFNMKCCLHGAVYAFVDRSVYRYRVNPDSVTFSYKKNFPDVWIGIGREFDREQKGLSARRRMDDLCAAHLLIGLYYYGKQETAAGHLPPEEIRRRLKQYMKDPLVARYAAVYKTEKYGKQLGSFLWRLFFGGAAFLIHRQWAGAAYVLFRVLLLLRTEERISAGSYRTKRVKGMMRV